MFEEIIEFDRDKIEANNYDIDKINAYLDELHDVKEIRKKAEGHYVGTTFRLRIHTIISGGPPAAGNLPASIQFLPPKSPAAQPALPA